MGKLIETLLSFGLQGCLQVRDTTPRLMNPAERDSGRRGQKQQPAERIWVRSDGQKDQQDQDDTGTACSDASALTDRTARYAQL